MVRTPLALLCALALSLSAAAQMPLEALAAPSPQPNPVASVVDAPFLNLVMLGDTTSSVFVPGPPQCQGCGATKTLTAGPAGSLLIWDVPVSDGAGNTGTLILGGFDIVPTHGTCAEDEASDCTTLKGCKFEVTIIYLVITPLANAGTLTYGGAAFPPTSITGPDALGNYVHVYRVPYDTISPKCSDSPSDDLEFKISDDPADASFPSGVVTVQKLPASTGVPKTAPQGERTFKLTCAACEVL